MPPTPQPIDVPFPIKGVDRSTDARRQPAFTTRDELNVRGVDLEDRLRGGKRPGLRKASTTLGGGVLAPRITGLFPITEAQGAPSSGSATTTYAIDDDFSSYSVGAAARLAGATTALKHEYVMTQGATAVGMRCRALWTTASTPSRLQLTGLTGNSAGTGSSFKALTLFGPNFACTGTVEVRIRANSQVNVITAGAGFGPNQACTGVGPFIRGSIDRRTCVAAYLVPLGANLIKLVIDEWTTSGGFYVRTTIAESLLGGGSGFTTAGSAGFPAADADNLKIKLFDTGDNTVRATIEWADQALVLTTLDATTTVSKNNPFGGIAGVIYATSASTPSNFTKDITRLTMARIAPAALSPVLTVDGEAAGAASFYLPSGSVGVNINSSGVFTQSTDVSNQSGSNPVWPAIDDGSNYIEGNAWSSGGTNFDFLFITYTADSPEQGYGIDYRISDQLVTSATTENGGVPYLRISDDLRSFLTYHTFNVAKSTDNVDAGITYISSGPPTFLEVVDGAVLATTALSDYGWTSIIFDRESLVRVTDDGTNIRFYVNGILRWTHTPTVYQPTGTNRIGFGLNPRATSGSTTRRLKFGRIMPGEVPAPTIVSEVRGKVLVLSDLVVKVLDVTDETMEELSTVDGFQNALPQATAFNRKWYAVDGAVERIIDPADSPPVTDWAPEVTDGMLPPDCRLITTYRNRIILARDADPTAWYASRVNDPLDWDFGADPLATAAVDDSTTNAGKPADTITALITWEDDLLVFGCASRMDVLEGDPGYQGTVQTLTSETGVAGPRAFTFDHRGSLYILGQAGAFRFMKGSREPELISGKRMAWLLDHLDLSTTLVQLTFDAFKRHVHYWLTPTDGSNGYHAIYDVQTDAWHLDQYPIAMQPFGACNILGDADEDRRWLIGGDDGYVRRPGEILTSDDSTAIDSWVDIGPFSIANGGVESMVKVLQAEIGSRTTGPITWYWFTGSSAEDVMSQGIADAVATGTWAAITAGVVRTGWQIPTGLRQRDAYHKIRIRQNSATYTWSLENVRAELEPRSKRGY